MSLDYAFHVEVRSAGMWRVPAALKPRSKWAKAGEFLSLSGKLGCNDLFFRRKALIPIKQAIPPQWDASELYAYLVEFYDFQKDEWRISWIPYESLFIDDWRSTQVLVSGAVTVELARLFGDGASLFPETALLAQGMSAWEVNNLRCGILIEDAINRCYGKRRDEIADAAPAERIPVSWSDTVWGYLGEHVASAFLNLRRFGADRNLRIISTLR